MISRNITAAIKKSPKSVLLLGPRQVGKSTLMKSLKPELSINLADQAEFFAFTSNPGELRERIETHEPKTVFIDEIQRYPDLLNTIQAISDENKKIKFYLTGSSARKLKRGQANLLPGRLVNYYLGPLVASELGYPAGDREILKHGSLPEIFLTKDLKFKEKLLSTYLSNYIQEEIKAEALVRNIDSFARALPEALGSSGQFLDYSKLAKRAKVSRHSLARFYDIFEDTLIGRRAWPDPDFLEKADLVKHPKFYVFDLGVYNSANQSYDISSDRKGILFEHLIHNQLLHSAWSRDKDISINTFRTRGGLEIDFIVKIDGQKFAIEAKAKEELHSDSVQPILKFKKEYDSGIECAALTLGKASKKIDGIWCHPWKKFLEEIGL